MVVSYRSNPVTRLYWVDWDKEFVVFDQTSGQTHLMDALRAYALNAMSDSPRDVESLVADLAGVADWNNDHGGLRAALHAALTEFDQLGLIETVSE